MKSALTIICLLFATSLLAQSITKEKLVGEWVCQETNFTDDSAIPPGDPKERQLIIEKTKEVFNGMSFIFGSDGLFKIKPAVKNELTEDLKFLNGKTWALDQQTNIIQIGGRENLMAIQVAEQNGNVTFTFTDAPLSLKMKKSEP